MITFHLCPIDSPRTLAVSVAGSIVHINGDDLDLSALGAGDEIEGEAARSLHPMLAGPIWRTGDEWHLTLFLPYSGPAQPHVTMPVPIIVTGDGPVDLPWPNYTETSEEVVGGGRNVTTTTFRWHQEPEVSTEYIADPEPIEMGE